MTTTKGYFTPGGTSSRKLTPQRDMYARPDSRVEYQLFGSEYFSNADVKVYFGDIWIEDATAIVMQLQENVLPIYGYNSFTYDSIARGRRSVQGQFNINFTSVGYLQQVLANANAILFALEKGQKKGIIKPEYYQNMKLSQILEKLGKDSFDQLADEYEKAIWGEGKDADEMLSYADMPYFRQDDLGFDLRIQYGAVSESTGMLSDRFYMREHAIRPNTTVDVINGVQISGMSKQITTQDQGAPIQEMYTFIARDVNGISLNHLQHQQTKKKDLNTTYRQMQYGVIK